MTSFTQITRIAFAPAILVLAATVLAPTPAQAQNQHMEVIQPPNYDRNMFMPFVPAIKIKRGKLLWLAGCELSPDRSAFRDESASASLALMNSN